MKNISRLAAFNALPPYPGGKRRLLPLIFGLLALVRPPETWSATTLADPFMGAGAISLAAKHLGFNVIANDIAERSAIVGRALIANSTQQLHPAQALTVSRAIVSPASSEILLRLAPLRAAFFEGARTTLFSLPPGAPRDLYALVLMKMLLSSFPMSLPTATDAVHASRADYDRLSPARLGHYLARHSIQPSEVLRTTAAVNAGVIPGNASFTKMDAFAFLPTSDPEIVILDPPYLGTQSYERAFRFVDDYLGAETLPTSSFSTSAAAIDQLLEACAHIPVLILCTGNGRLTEDEWVKIVERHRHIVRVVSVPFRHYGAIASTRKNSENCEILILAVTP